LPAATARQWEARIAEGAFLVGAHVQEPHVTGAQEVMRQAGARQVEVGAWRD